MKLGDPSPRASASRLFMSKRRVLSEIKNKTDEITTS